MIKIKSLLIAAAALLMGCAAAVSEPEEVTMKNVYGFEVENIDGETVKLSQYEGKVLLIVNTASKCGFTKQYDGLQKLYKKYKGQGFVILGFPSNDFLGQEPGSNQEIKSFCKINYGVDFPMFSKITVKGKEQHPLYKWLTSKEGNSQFPGKISWNFNKFLITRDGVVSGRFGSRTAPEDKKLIEALDKALKQGGEDKKDAK